MITQIMKHLFFIIYLACFSEIASGAAPCPNTPSVDAFICVANEEYHHLQLVGEVEILIQAPAPNTEGIIEEARKNIKPFLSKAKNAVFFNSHAGESLNDFHVYWITCIEDFHPHPYENLADYQKRADERYITLQEKANRLKISLE